MPKSKNTRPRSKRASAPVTTIPLLKGISVTLFPLLDRAKIAIECATDVLQVCQEALLHQDCNVDAAVAGTIDMAMSEHLEYACEKLMVAITTVTEGQS